jgi:hypothetical protein
MKKDKRILIPRDEFEEEAGDGLGRLSRDEAEADLRELKARMEGRLRRPRAIWLPAAAAVVILLVASGLLVTMLRDRPGSEPDVALAEETVTDTAYIAMATPVEKQVIESPAPVPSATTAIRTKEAKYGPLMAVVEEEVSEAAMADEMVVADDMKVEEETDDVVFAVVQQELAEEVIVQAVPQMTRAAMKARAETADRATVTEAAGKKEAAAVDAVTEGRKDAVAAPAGAAAVTGAVVPDSPASPVGGWSDYREYVSRNIRYPDGVRPVIRKEVMVSFTVRADSTIADLKALRSPGEAFTSEAFRLLREGPKWVPARTGGKVGSEAIVVMFVFK